MLTEEIDRVASIVRHLSAAPEVRDEDKAVDICELTRELMMLYREALFDSRGIAIETALPPQPIWVACDRDSIKHCLLYTSPSPRD